MILCLSSGALTAALLLNSFTLAWTHSIEKIRWEEDWRIEGAQLRLVEARVKGAGAGMEPPAGAQLRDGFWHYTPALAPLARLTLAHSPFTSGYELCADGQCRPLADYLPGITTIATIDLQACAPPAPFAALRAVTGVELW